MSPRHIVLGAGLMAAAWLAFFGDKRPDTEVVAPVIRDRATTVAAAPVAETFSTHGSSAIASSHEDTVQIHMLQPRETLIGGMRAESQSELFASQSWTPPPAPVKAEPPPPPTAPPLPFVYLGKKIEDDRWEAYLGHGDQTFIVQEQMTVMGMYRVDSIKPPTLQLTYLPLNQIQTLNIGGAD